MTPPRTFADLKQGNRTRCPECGDPYEPEAAGQITTVLKAGGQYLTSRTRTCCEPCSVRLFAEFWGDWAAVEEAA